MITRASRWSHRTISLSELSRFDWESPERLIFSLSLKADGLMSIAGLPAVLVGPFINSSLGLILAGTDPNHDIGESR